MFNHQKKKIFDKINSEEPVKITFKYVSEDILMLINSIITVVLGRRGQIFLLYPVITIVRELVVNSLKANAKRVFFEKKGLDINDPVQYCHGMSVFKEKIIGDFEFLKGDVVQSENSILFSVSQSSSGIHISVKNSAPILPSEQDRINKRIGIAVQKENFSEIYEDLEDDNEGAGLGIALIIMFVKSMGIDPSSFRIQSDGKVTVASLYIPSELKPVEVIAKVKTRILYEVKGLPTFPENIMTLLQMCLSPDAEINLIAEKIKHDVALTSDVIKLANSAGFITLGKVEDINRALVKIGLKNLHSILLASNARKILESRYARFEEVWIHCGRVAQYSKIIAQKHRLTGIAENAYIAGLLHDIGDVILLAVDMKAAKQIAQIVKNRDIINNSAVEEISIGISHSEIGALIAEKWNFPQSMIQVIRNHHSPLLAPEQFREITFTVYLANMICGIEQRKYYYHYIDEAVLERFGIDDEIQFSKFHEYLVNEAKKNI